VIALDLTDYLEVSSRKYQALIAAVEHPPAQDPLNSTLRFKYVKFDANGIPRFRDLAECLADHVITYCLSARRRGEPKSADEWSRLDREARNLLRRLAGSGEAGEILLYFLLEADLFAPQMVAKVDLKMNPRLEIHGSDGIHMRWDSESNVLEIFFGEAKLESDARSALRNIRDSLRKFHEGGMDRHELRLVTSHFKFADGPLRQEILEYIDPYNSTASYRVNHACLVGFSWDEYLRLSEETYRDAVEREFIARYESQVADLSADFEEILAGTLPEYHLDIFFLPFDNVQDFRRAFTEAVS